MTVAILMKKPATTDTTEPFLRNRSNRNRLNVCALITHFFMTFLMLSQSIFAQRLTESCLKLGAISGPYACAVLVLEKFGIYGHCLKLFGVR